jgi:hypothetical protein
LLVLSYVWVTRVVVDRPLHIFRLAKVRYVVPLVILFIGMGQILVGRSWIRIVRARRGVDRLRIARVMVLLFVIPVVILKVPRRIRKFLVTKSSVLPSIKASLAFLLPLIHVAVRGLVRKLHTDRRLLLTSLRIENWRIYVYMRILWRNCVHCV